MPRVAAHGLMPLLCGAMLAVGCGGDPSQVANLSVAWNLEPDPPVVGPARLTLDLADERGAPVLGSRVEVQADMSHPGMRPVLATAVERGGGRYVADFELTMAGEWFVIASGKLADGREFSRRIDLARVRSTP